MRLKSDNGHRKSRISLMFFFNIRNEEKKEKTLKLSIISRPCALASSGRSSKGLLWLTFNQNAIQPPYSLKVRSLRFTVVKKVKRKKKKHVCAPKALYPFVPERD